MTADQQYELFSSLINVGAGLITMAGIAFVFWIIYRNDR